MMNVSLYDRGVHAKSLSFFQTEIHRCLHHQFVDGTQRIRRQPVKGAIEGVVLGHRLTIEICELAQCVSAGDPFAQLAIVPVLDAHEDQRAQNLVLAQPTAIGRGIFQASFQIASHGRGHLFLVVQKIKDALQQRLQRDDLRDAA
jgi:hypothetical protein